MTPSGKLDRRSLPALSEAEEQSGYLPPRNEFETRLVGIWEDVLQARPIGIRDDFFALGGHSLSAVQVAVAMEKTFGRALSPGLLFESPDDRTALEPPIGELVRRRPRSARVAVARPIAARLYSSCIT